MTALFQKDSSIVDVVRRVTSVLPEVTWVDEWDVDLSAIGFSTPTCPQRLVYVCTYKLPPGQYFVVCDTYGFAQPDDVNQVERGVLDFDALLTVIREHLGIRP